VFVKALDGQIEFFQDIVIDVPHLGEYIGTSFGPAIVIKHLPVDKFFAMVKRHVTDPGQASDIAAAILLAGADADPSSKALFKFLEDEAAVAPFVAAFTAQKPRSAAMWEELTDLDLECLEDLAE